MSNHEINKVLLHEEKNRINQATEPEQVLDWKGAPLRHPEPYWWLNDELVSDSDLREWLNDDTVSDSELYEYLEERLGMTQYEG